MFHIRGRRCKIGILLFLELFKQIEAESVLPFMTNRKVGKDEVACGYGTVEVGHASDGCSSEYRERCWDTGSA